MILAFTSNTQALSQSVGVAINEKGISTVSAKRFVGGSSLPTVQISAVEQSPSNETSANQTDEKPQLELSLAEVQIIQRPAPDSQAASSSMAVGRSLAETEVRNVIDSRDVACRAAKEWLPAKQLRQHAHAVQQLYCEEDDCTRQAANAIARFFQLQADHQEDVAAAIALRAYYARSAINEQFELLQLSEAELQKQRERQAAIQQKGLAAAVDLTSLDREAITFNLQRIQLQQHDRQLKESLNDATHIQYDWDASLVEPLEVRQQALDVEYLQRFAIAHRRDFLAIQYLSGQINSGTAPMLSSVVNNVTGLASLPLPKRCFLDRVLGREDNSVLTNNLKQSIALACETQARTIHREVTEKAIALELAYQRIELSKETIASWNKRLAQLQRLAELGDSRPADLALAQTSQLGAMAVEIERRLEAKMAEIALAEATGGLAQRCCQGLAWLVTTERPAN